MKGGMMKRTIKYEVTVGVFVILAAVILGYMSLKISKVRVRDGMDVNFVFANACGLIKDSPVSVAGVDIGYVKNIKLEGNSAVLTARIESSARLRRNVSATIRTKGLLGEEYLEVVPGEGEAPLLEDGDTVTDTTIPVQIDQAFSAAGRILMEMNPGDAARIIRAVSENPDAVRRIIINSDRLLAELTRLDKKNIKEFVEQISVKARFF